MAKTLAEELAGLLSPEEQLALSILMKNEGAKTKLEKGMEFYGYYTGELTDPPAVVAPPVVPKVEPPVPVVAAPPVIPAPVVQPSNASLIAEMTALLDSRLTTMEEKFVTADKLPGYRADILGNAIKVSDDYATIRENHKEEFGERLNRDEYEKFVTEAPQGRYPTLKAAYDAYINEKRVETRVKKEVAEGIKQQTSAAHVPGQSQPAAMSPGLALVMKAKTKSADAGSSASEMAQRAKALIEARGETAAM